MHSQEKANAFALFVDDPVYLLKQVIMRPYRNKARVKQVIYRLAAELA